MGSIRGDASYYDCCNGTTACGNSFKPLTEWFAAWPSLRGFEGNPASSCISQTFNCGDRIVVMNECNGLFTDIPITDHAGPGVGCQMVNQFNTCPCDPKPRIVDLSTAAFVALGGNIVSGHFPVTISW